MKKLIVIFFYLLSYQVHSGDNVTGDLYGFIGIGPGYTLIDSDIAGDAGKKQGFYWQAQTSLTYYTSIFETSFAIGYFDTSQKPSNKAFTMTTQTTYLEFSPKFRFHHRFSIGPAYRQIIGEELLYAPSSVQNVNSDITTNNTLGLTLAYDIPIKGKYRMKLEASVQKAIDANERDMYLSFLQFSFGVRLHDEKPIGEKVIVKEVVREVIRTKPAEVIELDEQVLSFDSGRYEIKAESMEMLDSIASVLVENQEDWEIIKVVGHTDANGAEITNKILSEKRARAVAQVFLNRGIDAERIFIIGRGEEKLKSSGRTAQDHRLNRRVELNFVGRIKKSIAMKIKEITQQQRSDMNDTQ